MKNILYPLLLLFALGCYHSAFELKTAANDYFFLRNHGADMPVWVKGNSLSKTFILVLHGGPGAGAIGSESVLTSNEKLEKQYAMVYWEQRSSGICQGKYDIDKINAKQFVEDLEKLVILIKSKYGSDISLFLYGGSWGGYLGFAYLVKDDNQKNIKGWIDESGAHNFPLMVYAEKKILQEYASKFIDKNKDTDFWNEVQNWCTNNDTITTFDGFRTMNRYSVQAHDILSDSLNKISIDGQEYLDLMLSGPMSSRQASVNANQISESPLIQNILQLNVTPQLNKVTIPVLIMGGKYDVIVPNEVLYEAYDNVGSDYKDIVFFDKSGHAPSATQPEEFSTEVINFVDQFK